MIKHRIMEAEGILVLEPVSALSAEDFLDLASSVDTYLDGHQSFMGCSSMLSTSPGWESFAGLSAHLKFVRDHHKRIERIAIVTDSPLGTVAPALAKHFVSAQIRRFAYSEFDEALFWLKSNASDSADK